LAEDAVPYKTLLVHVDDGKNCAARIRIAVELAQRYDAHLIGLFATTDIPVPGYVATEIGVQTLADIEERARRARTSAASTLFDELTAGAGLPGVEWRESKLDAVAAVTLHARYADLIILGQPSPDDDSSVDKDFFEHVALGAGRPVIIVPYAGNFSSIGQNVLVAWNGSPEAMRALTDAIPLLRDAKHVRVVVFNPKQAADVNGPTRLHGSDIGLYLARHGINVEVSVQSSDDLDVGNQILSRVADQGIDLIVMGCYGHSRLLQMVLGGVTRTVLESMTAPVLMSH
jgi:nucleotide-binding universal stress UspA family protein